MKLTKYIAAGMIALTGLTACSDSFLETEYTQNLDEEAAAEAAGKNPDVFLNGMWSFMSTALQFSTSHDDFSFMSVLVSTDLMGQDIVMNGSSWMVYDYQLDNRVNNYRRTAVDWGTFYTLISKANEVLGLYPNGPETDSQKVLVGQALAIRAFSYYYLIQLYQFPTDASGKVNSSAKGVPLMYTAADGKSEAEIAAAKGRNTVADVYAQIEKDLTTAVADLEGYERPSKNYIDQHVAYGLLARYYLLSQQWEKAAEAASKAREGYKMMDNAGLHDGFMDISNAEWMWGFDETTETQTTFASFFSMMSNLAPGYASIQAPKLIDKQLYESIADDDYRKTLFTGPQGDKSQPTAAAQSPYANVKFGSDGSWTMDYMYMRAAEMVLIEAEAYAHLEQYDKAATTLKVLMANRQPSWNETSVTVDDVWLQRRIELWGEGFSYFDLKRLNKGINRNYSGSNHLAGYKLEVPAQDVRWTYQIPLKELQENKLIPLSDQNK